MSFFFLEKGLKKYLLLVILFILSSCSLLKSIGVKTTASVLKEGALEINTEANYLFFKDSASSNLKILESLWYVDQGNKDLLSLLIKGYGGYGFGVSETEYLNDFLKGEDESTHRTQALYHYSKAFNYGLKYLEQKGLSLSDIEGRDAAKNMKRRLDTFFNEKDMLALFYFAQSWAGMINLQRDDVKMLASLGTVKSMIDWVCSRDYEFETGACHLFYAVYEAGRPAILGGSLLKGKRLFENMISMYPYHILARVSFLQFYIIPTMDEELYAKEIAIIKRKVADFEGVRNYSKRTKRTKIYLDHPEVNLFNSIAIERLRIIENNKREIF